MDMKTDKSQILQWQKSQTGDYFSQWAQWTDHQSEILGYFENRKKQTTNNNKPTNQMKEKPQPRERKSM